MSPKPQSVTCEYCATLNLAGGHRCIACGAPLPVVAAPPIKGSEIETPIPSPELNPIPEQNQPLSQQLKEGAAVVGTGLGVLGIGGLILRTVAEAVAIAVAAFIIGLNAGNAQTNLEGFSIYLLLGAVGGALTGICVGLVTKRIIFSLLSAPVGAVLGSGIALLLSLNTPRSPWMALFAAAGAIFFALLGGHRYTGKLLPCYQRIRPFIGLVGGLLFGLLGYAAGFRIY